MAPSLPLGLSFFRLSREGPIAYNEHMKWLPTGLFIGQMALAIGGAKASPDYYARSQASVLRWAYSGGLLILAASLVITILIGYLAWKGSSKAAKVLFVLSALMTLAWFVYPMAFSILGDILFWRFP